MKDGYEYTGRERPVDIRTFRWRGGELLRELEPNPKVSSRIRRALCTTTRYKPRYEGMED